MRGIKNKIQITIVRNDNYYLITNLLSLTKKEIRDWYRKRGQIEEINKLLKSCLHINGCQSRRREVWENHIFLTILSFTFIELKRQRLSETVYKAKKNLILRDYAIYIRKWKSILKSA